MHAGPPSSPLHKDAQSQSLEPQVYESAGFCRGTKWHENSIQTCKRKPPWAHATVSKSPSRMRATCAHRSLGPPPALSRPLQQNNRFSARMQRLGGETGASRRQEVALTLCTAGACFGDVFSGWVRARARNMTSALLWTALSGQLMCSFAACSWQVRLEQ